LENGTEVAEAANKAALTPPIALDCQLVANPDVDYGTYSKRLDERDRLRKVLYDEILESMHEQLWYAGRKGNVSSLHHQKAIAGTSYSPRERDFISSGLRRQYMLSAWTMNS
jgi:hypothetical protein